MPDSIPVRLGELPSLERRAVGCPPLRIGGPALSDIFLLLTGLCAPLEAQADAKDSLASKKRRLLGRRYRILLV